jgi:hypothetical protein
LDNWLLPICLAAVSGWIALRQKSIFDEHKDMLRRLSRLELGEAVMENKIDGLAESQKEINATVKETLTILKSIQIDQAVRESKKE